MAMERWHNGREKGGAATLVIIRRHEEPHAFIVRPWPKPALYFDTTEKAREWLSNNGYALNTRYDD